MTVNVSVTGQIGLPERTGSVDDDESVAGPSTRLHANAPTT
jgi:hypothetical protein